MSDPDMSGEEIAREWLTWLYGEKFEGLIWIGGHADGFSGSLFADPAAAAGHAAAMDRAGEGKPWGVYHRLTTMREVESGRGKVEDSIALPALMMDLDLRGPGHKSDRYPETALQLDLLLADAGLPRPGAWVESGGGRYAVWKLAEPEIMWGYDEGLIALSVAQESSRALQRVVIDAGKARGWKVDNTSDLARIFRVPGTTNRKGGPGGEVMATWGVAKGGRTTFELRELRVAEGVATPVPSSSQVSPQPVYEPVDYAGGLAGLFAGAFAGGAAVHVGPRGFTVEQAMAFVAPALEALRGAQDGEINVRLNAAACALAHFGPEFWEESAADRQLQIALDATEYDGATWRAADTIASARRAMSGQGADAWRAVKVASEPTPAEIQAALVADPSPVDALLAEMLSLGGLEDRPPPKFMIHKLLQFDSESWVIGPPGSKKSFIVFDMAARIIRGEPWQGFRTNPADVVMIVGEGASGVGKRAKAWRARHGAIEPAGEQRFHVLPRPVQAQDRAAWMVLVEACRRLADSARDRGRGLLVILDTQARVTVGMKENDNGDMNEFTRAVGDIRSATGACVLTVHHSGKSSTDGRGASVIDGAQTTALKVAVGKHKLTCLLSVSKQKDIDEIDDVRLAFDVVDLGQDPDGEALNSLVLCETDSAGFRLAWSGAEITADGVEAEEAARVTPFKGRVSLDAWIVERESRAALQHWIVQALVDTAETLGLTQSEVKGIVEEKRGVVDKTTFKRAWQKITEEGGPWSDVVSACGGQRWSVDRVSIAGLSRGNIGD